MTTLNRVALRVSLFAHIREEYRVYQKDSLPARTIAAGFRLASVGSGGVEDQGFAGPLNRFTVSCIAALVGIFELVH